MGSTYFSKRIPNRVNVRTERSRPKSFKTEEKAKEYIAQQKGEWAVVQLSEHKFRVQELVTEKKTKNKTSKAKTAAKN